MTQKSLQSYLILIQVSYTYSVTKIVTPVNNIYFYDLFFPDGHLKVTECSSSHSRQALCCKMAAEFDAFLESEKKVSLMFLNQDSYAM